jgi:rhodanese-related sulfurtransferase
MGDGIATDGEDHWEAVYSARAETGASSYQDEPRLSFELIQAIAPAEGGRIIDVGNGTSVLVDRLLDLPFGEIAVLDISETALGKARARLGERAGRVRWVIADVTEAPELGTFDVWHDRAAFHFLTDAADRRKYLALVARTVPAGGHVVIGAFALDGPDSCNGLSAERYDANKLAGELGPAFALRRETQETHLTPSGKPQRFTYAVFQRLPTPDKVDAETLRQWLADGRPVVVVDVRNDEDRARGAIPGSVHFDAMTALKSSDATAMDALDVPAGACVVTVCNLGHAAGTAARLLRERGIEASSLEGGIKAWDGSG